jgi:hypothetical protein
MVEPGTGRDKSRPYGMVEPGTGRDKSRPYGMVEPGTGRDEARPTGWSNRAQGVMKHAPTGWYHGWFDEMGDFSRWKKASNQILIRSNGKMYMASGIGAHVI